MATRRQPLIPGWLIPGVSATTLVVAVALAAFLALWWNAPQDDWVAVWQDSYLWHVVRFSFWQAFLSALLSVIPAIFLARALYRRRFPGRLALLRLCAMTLILPVLVAVFGILSVYGRQGWLATLCQSLGLEWTFSPYGLQGILLAHVFFNLPMASRLLLQALENIPGELILRKQEADVDLFQDYTCDSVLSDIFPRWIGTLLQMTKEDFETLSHK